MNDRTTRRGRNRTPTRGEPVRDRGADRACVAGQAVAGPAFYIWDEDPRHATQWGAELADAWLASHTRPR